MKPLNVLLILTDQQRKDSLGCYGNSYANTPCINSLAAEGMRFERYYAANPICMPNRLSIFTGQYPHNHGMWTNGLNLPHEIPTIADYLSQQGYQTASFGKIHFTPNGGNAGNRESSQYWKSVGDDFNWNGPYWGFEHIELTLGHTSTLAHYGRWFRQHGGIPQMMERHDGPIMSGIRDIPVSLHDSTFVGERTSEFIRNERDPSRPFFIVASFPDPHPPFNPPREMADKYFGSPVKEPIGGPEDLQTRPEHYRKHLNGEWHRKGLIPARHPGGISKEDRIEMIQYAYAMVELIDRNVGKIVSTLEKEHLLENTIILFTTDHGELLGDHGLWSKGPFFYEGLVNIPLIVSCKGLITPGVSNELTSTVDMYPTLCELLGIAIPKSVDGISFATQMNEGKATRKRCLLEYRNGYGESDRACAVLIDKRFKLVVYQDGEFELTDLSKDPDEKQNLAYSPEYHEIAQELHRDLILELLKTGNRFPGQIAHA